jgi:hypothetical protein
MFEQLLPNKNKIITVWRNTYYAKFGSKNLESKHGRSRSIKGGVGKRGSRVVVAIRHVLVIEKYSFVFADMCTRYGQSHRKYAS